MPTAAACCAGTGPTRCCSDRSRFALVESQTSISCVEGSPVRTYPRPERAAASKASAPASGASSPEWFVVYDPASSSWRTSPRSEDEASIVFSGTWPRAGTMRRGTACPQRPSAPLTAATGSSWSRGAYPTPSAASYGSASCRMRDRARERRASRRGRADARAGPRRRRRWRRRPTSSRRATREAIRAGRATRARRGRAGRRRSRTTRRADAAPAARRGAGRDRSRAKRGAGQRRPLATRARAGRDGVELARAERTPERRDGRELPIWPPDSDDLLAWRTVPPAAQPAVCGVADVVPDRFQRLRALGNAVVPAVAEVVGHVALGIARWLTRSAGPRRHSALGRTDSVRAGATVSVTPCSSTTTSSASGKNPRVAELTRNS